MYGICFGFEQQSRQNMVFLAGFYRSRLRKSRVEITARYIRHSDLNRRREADKHWDLSSIFWVERTSQVRVSCFEGVGVQRDKRTEHLLFVEAFLSIPGGRDSTAMSRRHDNFGQMREETEYTAVSSISELRQSPKRQRARHEYPVLLVLAREKEQRNICRFILTLSREEYIRRPYRILKEP